MQTPDHPTLEYASPVPAKPPIRPSPLTIAFVAPTVVHAVTIVILEWADPHSARCVWCGWGSIIFSIAIGWALLIYSHVRWPWIVALLIGFSVVQLVWLVVFTLEFCCSVFGDCI
jgi:hypothetical protein